MNTGEKLKIIRLALGLSQEKLAMLWKIGRPMISQFETNTKKLPLPLANILIDYCKAHNLRIGTKKKSQEVTLDYLYREDDINE